MAGLKIHAKTALVVRKEAGRLRCYAHIGTGNYNNVCTARMYTDVGLLTADPVLTGDVVRFFDHPTGRAEIPEVPAAARRASNATRRGCWTESVPRGGGSTSRTSRPNRPRLTS